MCGIIGYIGSQDPKGILLDGLKRLEYRGYDSAGIAVFEKDHVEVYRCEGRLQRLEEKLSDHVFQGSVGMGHTRWATHGAPTEVNAHPHTDDAGRIALIHNGIIENYAALRKVLSDRGHTFKSQTDTEVLAVLIGHVYSELKAKNHIPAGVSLL